MLQLQRASAGSGKTYTLAKKFIWFLITIKESGHTLRLRSSKEIADGLGRILAITFTNKATNEMKQRIVDKLADLSRAADNELSDNDISSIAYLTEFASALNVSPQTIGKTCQEALSVLLNDYSDFKVSTIDSFFQSVLRTFAYESNLNDSYQVEIDTDYLATAAVDATLDTVDKATGEKSSASLWLQILMDDAASTGSQWNVFQKSETTRSIYNRIRHSIFRLESEEFKEIRKELDEYFENDNEADPLAQAYIRLKSRLEKPLQDAIDNTQKYCRQLEKLIHSEGLDAKEDCQRWFDSHLRKIPQLVFNETSSKPPFKPLTISDKKSLLKKGVSSSHEAEINYLASMMYAEYSRWLELRETPEWKHWAIYAPLIPYLGLLGEARRKMKEFLDSNNMIQLGETNAMLKRIIGDDDTPFIYERLGTTVNHYLIDEFQDTSRMQWDNLMPLLLESDSRGEDNLIIGDAKQSIYRFRNAEPSLITTTVPETFPTHLAAGMSKEDNTNWRSDRRIVEFNNFFFHFLVKEIEKLGKGTLDFSDLYGNVAQYPSHRQPAGYIEIRFKESISTSDEVDNEESEGNPLEEVCPLISSLLERGYECRDIALLVDTNQLGKDVIAAIVAYNATLPKGKRKIDFISEESLLVSSADAVGIIIGVLEKMISGIRKTDKDEENEQQHHEWNDIRSNFSFFSLRHPEMSVAQQITEFLNEDSPVEAINSMLSSMQTVALPALVEAITENFVPVNLRRSQAVYIAALQDMVLEYCDRYAADVASFLNWWNAKGKDRSISSPEGVDAVQIMTVHKAKGLEFKCVILPYATASITPRRKSEWRWVRPAACFSEAALPPFLPVETTPDLEHTEHAAIYQRYFDLYMMDRLNSTYVAFTRAISELYIITKAPKRADSSIGYYLKAICGDADELICTEDDTSLKGLMFPPGISKWNQNETILSFGDKPNITQETDSDSDSISSDSELIIEEYGVDSSATVLHYVESDLESATLLPEINDYTIEDDPTSTMIPEAADNDPRSDGNLLHAIMGMVKTSEDLPRAILSMKTRGLITGEQALEWEEMLKEAIQIPEIKKWFIPGNRWKILNERAILVPWSADRRPDRIMISPDREQAVIIDYKFGHERYDKAYSKQIKDYMTKLRESSGIRNIKGYLWYVRTNKIIEIH